MAEKFKRFIVVTGLPGSGKTRFANKLKEDEEKAGYSVVMCCADDFFMSSPEPGLPPVYIFQPALIAQAHSECMAKAFDAFRDKVDTVILHNTGSQLWEYENYLRCALIAGYELLIYKMECRGREDILEFHRRNVHNVPLQTLANMWLRWEDHRLAKLVHQETMT